MDLTFLNLAVHSHHLLMAYDFRIILYSCHFLQLVIEVGPPEHGLVI